MPVYITYISSEQILKAGDAEGVVFLHHDALSSPDALDKTHPAVGKIPLYVGGIVAAVGFVEQVTAGGVGLTAADGHDAAHGADVGRTHVKLPAALMEHIPELIEQGIMAADNDKARFKLRLWAKQPDADLGACLHAFAALRYLKDSVGLHK